MVKRLIVVQLATYGKKKVNSSIQKFLIFKKFLYGFLHHNIEDEHHWWKQIDEKTDLTKGVTLSKKNKI